MELPRAIGQEDVFRLFSALFGRKVGIKVSVPILLASKPTPFVGVFGTDDGNTEAIFLCDMHFAGLSGAALSMIPVASALESIQAGALENNLIENFHEVLNIASRLFQRPGLPRVSLKELFSTTEKVPAEIQKKLTTPISQLGVEMTIPGYGIGKLSIFTYFETA